MLLFIYYEFRIIYYEFKLLQIIYYEYYEIIIFIAKKKFEWFKMKIFLHLWL